MNDKEYIEFLNFVTGFDGTNRVLTGHPGVGDIPVVEVLTRTKSVAEKLSAALGEASLLINDGINDNVGRPSSDFKIPLYQTRVGQDRANDKWWRMTFVDVRLDPSLLNPPTPNYSSPHHSR